VSNFSGDCGCECLPSSGWCEKHKRFVRIILMDGKTSRELRWEDEQAEREDEDAGNE
jgi:hypothetical protein